jgi:hypothetical protein
MGLLLPAGCKNIPAAWFFLFQASKLFSGGEIVLFRFDNVDDRAVCGATWLW